MSFNENRYAFAENLIPKDLCAVATQYALFKQKYFDSREDSIEGQIPNTTSIYNDTLMETLMYFMHPHMETITGLKLCPTYTYYRVYKAGDELKRHSDRESCEISTTVCLGYDYKGCDEDYKWGMYVDSESNHHLPESKDEDGKFKSDNRDGVLLKQNSGDCIIYRGCELEHWRDPFEVSEGSYQVQVFMHYIDMNGTHYPEFKFDQREGIAAPKTL
tara:strand:- start:84 stop:734 length:651 start_codon:yes stop_codon:yes gene_type:complete